jgi:hypothetical protein
MEIILWLPKKVLMTDTGAIAAAILGGMGWFLESSTEKRIA